ncbi:MULTISPECIES: PIN domain nuclease [Sphingomonas]|jgi:predicted nucleic acid-binding protein|uniref:Ribonuclease VapC n=1 Tax=Sphingomonas taxi TaxID=1549858 RepID=A0A097EH13_9SPHN|nr:MULTISPECIES: PIN domain nuclease [Sphingomonas]AIT06846.1 twitching motility protein PilT [Sphingomonas taxi]
MILVDSSVWIDKLAHRRTVQTEVLEALILAEQDIGVGDLMLVEVLQGTRDVRAYRHAEALLAEFDMVQISDHHVAVAAARHYRHLRGLGITIRKTIDTLIATRCILDRLPLLYSDRDFDPFVQHLGLRSALDAPGVN